MTEKERSALIAQPSVLEGTLELASERREAGGRYGVGDLVTRDGTDIHRVVDICEGGDGGTFECVQAPAPWIDPNDELVAEPWCKVGDREFNLTRRYSPVQAPPSQLANSDD